MKGETFSLPSVFLFSLFLFKCLSFPLSYSFFPFTHGVLYLSSTIPTGTVLIAISRPRLFVILFFVFQFVFHFVSFFFSSHVVARILPFLLVSSYFASDWVSSFSSGLAFDLISSFLHSLELKECPSSRDLFWIPLPSNPLIHSLRGTRCSLRKNVELSSCVPLFSVAL